MSVPATELARAPRIQPGDFRGTTEIVQIPIYYEIPERAQMPPRPLSPRQREIFQLKGLGLSNLEIAEILGIADRTVIDHISKGIRKTGGSVFDTIAGMIRAGEANIGLLSTGLEFERIGLLSDREREILDAMIIPGLGSYSKTVADHLQVSESTVKRHISDILRKLDVKTSLRARVFWLLTSPHLLESPKPPESEKQIARDFTPAEVRVMLLKAKGFENEEIADQLRISYHAVDVHVASAVSKAPEQNTISAIVKIVESKHAARDEIIKDFDFEKYFLLSPRKREVVDEFAKKENWDLVNKKVAHDLGITIKTLKNYLQSIFATLDIPFVNGIRGIRLKLFSIYLPKGIRDLRSSFPGVDGPLSDARSLDGLSDQERALFYTLRSSGTIGRMSGYFSELGLSNLDGWDLLLGMLPKIGARNIGEIKNLQLI